ncbi:hypothetical protein BDA99DRAFT_509866 [Phascolomyces articulosus]|uniref:Uncharacterized protein n=1 Tax=Phascolomyces articulosus TaxID=60185 RepID=A0AAD5K0A7_9FUNG|nr:hypothetical protein BDA99DRAFT_509866 [Phascolomyces articulosus]
MMPHNNAFQPKNARTIQPFDDDDDDFDDTSLFGSSITTNTKKTSGTQALADFLNTTSPEEFQRPSPASTISTSSSTTTSSSTFFRLRKSKRPSNNNNASSSVSSITSTTPTPTPTTTLSTLGDLPNNTISMIQQGGSGKNKKHIEIVPSRSTQKHQQPYNFQRPPLQPQHQQHPTKQPAPPSSHHPHSQQQQQQPSSPPPSQQHVPIQQRPLPRIPTSPTASLSSSHQSLALREPQSPILPNRRRESSLYSGSLRNNASLRGRFSDYGSSSAGRAPATSNRRNIMELFDQPMPPQPTSTSTKPKEIDHIDTALLQRLEQHPNTISNESTPLPKEIQTILSPTTTTTKTRRHCQTQTIQTCISEPLSPLDRHPHQVLQRSHSLSMSGTTVEQLEKQIAEEKRRQKRLQVAMQESTDQFEVLSGLAYMKLRELWEERMRWEEAYFTLNERLEEIHQQRQQQQGGGMMDPNSVPSAAALVSQLPPPPPAQSI